MLAVLNAFIHKRVQKDYSLIISGTCPLNSKSVNRVGQRVICLNRLHLPKDLLIDIKIVSPPSPLTDRMAGVSQWRRAVIMCQKTLNQD